MKLFKHFSGIDHPETGMCIAWMVLIVYYSLAVLLLRMALFVGSKATSLQTILLKPTRDERNFSGKAKRIRQPEWFSSGKFLNFKFSVASQRV